MNTHQDSLSELLKQVPLESPSSDFTKRMMQQIRDIKIEDRVRFYQTPLFISIVGLAFAACVMLFYNADFSITMLVKQITYYYQSLREYFPSINLKPRQVTLSPLLITPLLLIFFIFVVDRIIMALHKKDRRHRTFYM